MGNFLPDTNANPGILDQTYDPNAQTGGGFDLFGGLGNFGGGGFGGFNFGGGSSQQNNGYNAPQQAGYGAPGKQSGYGAPTQQNRYNPPQQSGFIGPQPQQPSYNSGTGNRVDFNIPIENQVEVEFYFCFKKNLLYLLA